MFVVCYIYRITLGKDWGLDGLARSRRQTKLPVVLSVDEVTRFFEAITSLRHRAILMTAYAAGLRISEVLALRVDDIDSQRMVIRVRQGKGSKDRYVMLSPRLLTLLREYWKAHRRRKVYQPSPWLFPGNVPGRPITDGAVYEACEEACRAAGLIQQAILQVLQRRWDPTFSEHSYGFRPGRSAHQALAQAQRLCRRRLRMGILGSTAHVFLREAARPFAGGRLDLSLRFHDDHERAPCPSREPHPGFYPMAPDQESSVFGQSRVHDTKKEKNERNSLATFASRGTIRNVMGPVRHRSRSQSKLEWTSWDIR